MADKVIIEYEARTAEAADGVEQLKTKTSEAGDASKKASKDATDGFKDQEKAMGSASNLIDKVFPIKMVQGYAREVQTTTRAMFGLTGATKAATVAVKAKAIALKVLRGALIATGIGAIVVLLGSLVAWLSRTTEGADFMARKMAFVSEIFDTLGGMAADLGQMLIDAFRNPREALMHFAEALMDPIGTFKKLANGAKDMAKDVVDAGNAATDLSDRMRQLERDEDAFSVTKARGSKIVARAMEQARDETRSIEERSEALQRAGKIQEQVIDAEMKLAERKKQLMLEDARMTDNQDKRREMINEANREFFKTEERLANERRTLRRFENTIENQAQREREDLAERRIESELEVLRLTAETVDDRIDIIKRERDEALKQEGLLASEKKAIRLQSEADIEEIIEEASEAEREAAAERIEIEMDLQKRRREAAIKTAQINTETIQDEMEVERMRRDHLLEQDNLLAEEKELIELEHQERIAEIRDRAREEEIEKERELRRELTQIAQNAAGDAMRIMDNKAQHRINMIDDMLDREVISEEEASRKKAEIQREQAEREKRMAIAQAIINTAVAVTRALAVSRVLAIAVAAAGALQVAAIRTEPIPSFAEGVIGLKGRGTSKSDSIPAMLSKGESVMTADETKRHRGLFEAIRSGQNITYSQMVAPEKRRESEAGGVFDDSNIVRELRENRSVKISNIRENARIQAKEHARWSYRNKKYA